MHANMQSYLDIHCTLKWKNDRKQKIPSQDRKWWLSRTISGCPVGYGNHLQKTPKAYVSALSVVFGAGGMAEDFAFVGSIHGKKRKGKSQCSKKGKVLMD